MRGKCKERATIAFLRNRRTPDLGEMNMKVSCLLMATFGDWLKSQKRQQGCHSKKFAQAPQDELRTFARACSRSAIRSEVASRPMLRRTMRCS